MRIISGEYGRRRFAVPGNITARPTTDFARENLFNVLGNIVDFEGLVALDLFAGTGAITFELLSRGAACVTAVEKTATQYNFIAGVAGKLGCTNRLRLVRGDVFRYLSNAAPSQMELVFADPPYAHERFAEIPLIIIESGIIKPGGLLVIEHSRAHDFSSLPGFEDHRVYGSVNFSLLRMPVQK